MTQQKLIDDLGFIAMHKDMLPFRLRGWVNALGLYVRERRAGQWTRLQEPDSKLGSRINRLSPMAHQAPHMTLASGLAWLTVCAIYRDRSTQNTGKIAT